MALNPLNSSKLEQLALKGLSFILYLLNTTLLKPAEGNYVCFIVAKHLMQTAPWITTVKAYQLVPTTSTVEVQYTEVHTHD